MIPKLNFVSVLAAAVFFFLPWISIECSGERMATQTGFQTITGSATATARSQSNRPQADGRGDGSIGDSYLAAFAFIGVLAALGMAFAALTSGRADLVRMSGFLCACALGCLLVQAALGFPAKTGIEKKMREGEKPAAGQATAFDELGMGLAKGVLERIKISTTPWFYLELASLGVPLLLLGAFRPREE